MNLLIFFPGITFHSYQELAGSVVRGTAEERTKLIFAVYERNIKTEGLLASDLLAFVIGIGRVFTSFYTNKRLAKESFTSFGESMVHDLCFPRNQPKKSFLRLSPEDDPGKSVTLTRINVVSPSFIFNWRHENVAFVTHTWAKPV